MSSKRSTMPGFNVYDGSTVSGSDVTWRSEPGVRSGGVVPASEWVHSPQFTMISPCVQTCDISVKAWCGGNQSCLTLGYAWCKSMCGK